jgi:hypothetical protein
MSNDGPTVHTEGRFREQQGVSRSLPRARRRRRGRLTAVDDLCPAIAEYMKGVPRRATTMKLRGVLANPRDASFTRPVLLCDWLDATTPEVEALGIRDVAARPWIALGSGNGLRVKITGAPSNLIGDPPRVTVEPAPAALDLDAWQPPF